MIEDDIVKMESRSVANIIQRGGTILKTARCKEFFELEGRQKAYKNLKKKRNQCTRDNRSWFYPSGPQWSRSGHLNVPRADDYALLPTERGAIDNLRLTEDEVSAPDEGYVQVRVEAAGLNFRDVLNVLGLYPGDPGRSVATSPAPSPNWARA